MSLFDVFRYPLSPVPTPEELEKLPDSLFIEWRSQSVWAKGKAKNYSRIEIGEWYVGSSVGYEVDQKDIKLLRKMIAEYQE